MPHSHLRLLSSPKSWRRSRFLVLHCSPPNTHTLGTCGLWHPKTYALLGGSVLIFPLHMFGAVLINGLKDHGNSRCEKSMKRGSAGRHLHAPFENLSS